MKRASFSESVVFGGERMNLHYSFAIGEEAGVYGARVGLRPGGSMGVCGDFFHLGRRVSPEGYEQVEATGPLAAYLKSRLEELKVGFDIVSQVCDQFMSSGEFEFSGSWT
jgi:hypothetical protein